MKKLFAAFSLLVVISGICIFPATSVFAEGETDKDQKELDITISATENLFDIGNMKPGDWAPRTHYSHQFRKQRLCLPNGIGKHW